MERREAASHVRDQAGVDGRGDGVGEQRRLEVRLVVAHLLGEHARLHRRVERRADGALEALERPKEGREGEVAIGLDPRLALEPVGRLIEGELFAGGELHLGPRQIGVGEQPVDAPASAREIAGLGGDALLRPGEGVGPKTERVIEEEPPGLEALVLGEEALHLGRVEAQDLGLHPARHRAELHVELLSRLALLERRREARVLVGPGRGVDDEALELELHLPDLVEGLVHRRRRAAELPLVTGQAGDLLGRRVSRRRPGRVARVEVGEVPLVFVGELAAIFGGSGHGGERGEQGEGETSHRAFLSSGPRRSARRGDPVLPNRQDRARQALRDRRITVEGSRVAGRPRERPAPRPRAARCAR